MFRKLLCSAVLSTLALAGYSQAQQSLPPIEAYGELPTISDLALSPSGNMLAFINRSNGINALQVIDLSKNGDNVLSLIHI